MPDSTEPPSRLSQLPGHQGGGGIYIALAAVLLLAIGGLVYWKVKADSAPLPAPVATAPPVTPPAQVLAEPPPPPPPEEDAAAPTPTAKVAGTGGPSPCSATCTGTASGALTSALSARAGSARGCYERALRVNAQLQGKLTVSVRIDPQGNVCSAGISQDGVHSGDVSSCVVGMFRGGKFPAPQGGCIDVNVPMSFVPREGK